MARWKINLCGASSTRIADQFRTKEMILLMSKFKLELSRVTMWIKTKTMRIPLIDYIKTNHMFHVFSFIR